MVKSQPNRYIQVTGDNGYKLRVITVIVTGLYGQVIGDTYIYCSCAEYYP